MGAWAYAVQIYADFSGYTDIAIGIALLMGIKFPDNFDQPYSSRSIQEFWRRWHMTLSRWLRDYLYIPLGGNRGGPRAEYRNLFLTMLLGGLWHGASWNFVIWGAFHGVRPGGSNGATRCASRGRPTSTWARRASLPPSSAAPDGPVAPPGWAERLGLARPPRRARSARRRRPAESAAVSVPPGRRHDRHGATRPWSSAATHEPLAGPAAGCSTS